MFAKLALSLGCAGLLACLAGPARAQVPGGERAKERAELWKRALALNGQGKFAEAIPLAEKVVGIDREARADMDEASLATLQFLGHLYWKTNQLDDADECLREVYKQGLTVLGPSHPGYLRNKIDLGILETEMGLLERADDLLRAAYRAKAEQGKRDDLMEYASRSLGMHYLRKREFDRAEPLLKQALAIRGELKGKKSPGYAAGLNDLGILYTDMRRFQLALASYQESLEIVRAGAGASSEAYAVTLSNMAVVHHYLGDLAQARRLTQESQDVMKRLYGEDHVKCAGNYLSLGQLSYALGEYDDADRSLRRALALYDKNQKAASRNYVLALRALADVHMALDRPAEALAWQWRALDADQEQVRRVFSISTESGMFAYLESVGGDYEALLAMALGRQKADPSVATRALTWTLRRKGIIVETMAQYRAQEQAVHHDPSVAPAARELQALRKQLAAAEADAAGRSDPGLEGKRRSLADKVYKQEQFLHRKLSAYRQQQTQPFHAVDAEQVRKKLPADAALVEIVQARVPDFKHKGPGPYWGPAHYLAFVLTPEAEAPARLFDLGPAKAVDAAVRAFREKIEQAPRELRASDEKAVEEDFRPAAGELYQLVFAPLRPALGKATTLYVAPDGELNRIPFQALVDPDGKYLIESYRFAYLLTGRDLLRPREAAVSADAPHPPGAPAPVKPPRGPQPGGTTARAPEPGRGTIIFAAPDYDLKPDQRESRAQELLKKAGLGQPAAVRGAAVDTRGLRWQPLPGAAAEAEDLKKVLQGPRFRPVKTYQGADALEGVFKAITPPRVLHVATHGFFLPDEKPDAAGEGPAEARGAGGAASGLAQLRKARNPLLRSGIVLAGANTAAEKSAASVDDGLVTAEEIALMNLRGTELVVLSACESGLGNVRIGEGVYGLRHAFLYAGARSLVTSLFEVPDAETRELMRGFYEGLDARRGKLQALHETQLALVRKRRRDKEAAHPFFWASFVLVGDPN